jgi:hypothetical protein
MSDTQSTQLLQDHREEGHENQQNANSNTYKKNVQNSKDMLWKQIRIMIFFSFLFSLSLFAVFYWQIK